MRDRPAPSTASARRTGIVVLLVVAMVAALGGGIWLSRESWQQPVVVVISPGMGEAVKALEAGSLDADSQTDPASWTTAKDEAHGILPPAVAVILEANPSATPRANFPAGSPDAVEVPQVTGQLLPYNARPNLTTPAGRAELARQLKAVEDARLQDAQEKARALGLPLSGTKPDGGHYLLRDFDGGRPASGCDE